MNKTITPEEEFKLFEIFEKLRGQVKDFDEFKKKAPPQVSLDNDLIDNGTYGHNTEKLPPHSCVKYNWQEGGPLKLKFFKDEKKET